MAQKRRLFCELSPLCYKLSEFRCRAQRALCDLPHRRRFARERREEPLPELVCSHRSLIRRRLGNVDARLQENKAVNLALAAREVHGVLIRPGQVFSFWRMVGDCTARRGYLEGLVISNGKTGRSVGGGMCQFTNLIHWMVLHTPLTICERHHHDAFDLFPDFGRQVPFGVGTSIKYNYLDYRFANRTDQTWQLLTWVDGEYLCGELRAQHPLGVKYHVRAADEYFSHETDGWYRNNRIVRTCVSKKTGNLLSRQTLQHSHARIFYDPALIPADAELREAAGAPAG